jgi:hypothetical protein
MKLPNPNTVPATKTEADDHRIDVHVVGKPGADAENLAVDAVAVEPGRRAAAGRATIERAHARIPTTECTSCAETLRLLTISRPLMKIALTTASAWRANIEKPDIAYSPFNITRRLFPSISVLTHKACQIEKTAGISHS